jgi:hypothetical protein
MSLYEQIIAASTTRESREDVIGLLQAELPCMVCYTSIRCCSRSRHSINLRLSAAFFHLPSVASVKQKHTAYVFYWLQSPTSLIL